MKNKKWNLILISLIVFFCAIELPSLGLATTYYVATNGNDSYNGLYPSYQGGSNGPFRTLGHAASTVMAGDTVQVRTGTYHEVVTVNANGTSSNRITITNYSGETPVIDGQYTLPGGSVFYYLVNINGDYVTFRNITIEHSAGAGLVLAGHYDYAINIIVNGAREVGICGGGGTATYNIVDGCTATDTGNGYGINGQTSWGAGIVVQGDHNTIQNCISYENRGEGLNTCKNSTNAIIQDSISYDNQAYNLYIDSATGATVRRNMVYQTKSQYMMNGITIGAETGLPSDISIYNNLVMGCRVNFEIDSNVTTLSNVKVAYNTFVNSVGGVSGYNMGVYYRPDINTYSDSKFENNIVIEEDPTRVPISVESSHSGLTFAYNCWNKTPVAAAQGTGSVIADPLLTKTGSTGPGSLTPEWFKILENSPAKDRATVLSEVIDDFFKTPRGSSPDMGAFELSDGTSSLTASATGSPTAGQAPLSVNFTGSASGGTSPYSYRWTFGDGGSSTSQNPSYTYSSAGSYTATLTVTDNASAAASSTVNINVTASVPLSANIIASPTSGQAPLAVNFTGSASGGAAPYTYNWTFGDGESSTTQNPGHTYSTAGNYTATLTVTDSKSATNSKSLTISVTAAPSPLVANASASPSSGQAPLAVNFTGSASGGTAPYSYRWTFGDSGSSTTQNPSHTYSTAGSYTATLTVTDSQSATNSKSLTISVTAAPSPLSVSVSASPSSGQAPLAVNFTGSASGGSAPYTYRWTFGDSGSSTTQSPSHTYSTAGNYTATLTVTDSQSATNSKSLTINVTAAPSPFTATASATPTSGLAPLAVNFNGSATGGISPYTYSWNFGDGGSATTQNPSHTYSTAGSYTATLTVTDSQSATNGKSLTISVTAAPSPFTATASASPTSGQVPLTVNFTGSATGGTTPYAYSWNFGDGGSSSIQNPSHSYSAIGNYAATLTVTDINSTNANATVNIAVVSISAANLALSSETGAPAPGQGGTTDPSPGNHSFSVGSTVQVKSIPNTEYRFSKWAGDITESGTFSSIITLTMDKNKSLSATFCTKCADVNGDLKITPADAQRAFDIYLGRVSNPTWCELENADVKCDGTRLSPKVTPSDAQTIFHKYLKRQVASGDCSGNSRAAALSMQNLGFTNVNLTINNITFTPGEDILIPVIIESPSDIKAFGFDLAFPSNILTYIGLESTELTKDYDQLDANVISYQAINREGTKTESAKNLFSGFDSIFASKILALQAVNSRESSQDFDPPVANMINYRMLRVGGYKTKPTVNPSSGVLVTLIFRVVGEIKDTIQILVIATYDDIQNASIGNRMLIPKSREIERPTSASRPKRKFVGKRYDF